jgi:hypothetical protein
MSNTVIEFGVHAGRHVLLIEMEPPREEGEWDSAINVATKAARSNSDIVLLCGSGLKYHNLFDLIRELHIAGKLVHVLLGWRDTFVANDIQIRGRVEKPDWVSLSGPTGSTGLSEILLADEFMFTAESAAGLGASFLDFWRVVEEFKVQHQLLGKPCFVAPRYGDLTTKIELRDVVMSSGSPWGGELILARDAAEFGEIKDKGTYL